jgi:excinuclease ABC subunit A
MSDEGGNPTAIRLRGVQVHNLQKIDLDIPLHALTVICGVSGAGKSSLALDTLYAEAYHRYLQSLSPQTRQYLEQVQKPDAEHIEDLPPAIAVSQRNLPQGPRTTVGTMTEVVDYLRLLFTRAGVQRCLKCGHVVQPSTIADVLTAAAQIPEGTRFSIAFPRKIGQGGSIQEQINQLREDGFVRAQLGDQVVRLEEVNAEALDAEATLWVLVDRLEVGKATGPRLSDSLETAFTFGRGRLGLLLDDRQMVFDQRSICPVCDTEYPALEARLLDFNDPTGACSACGGTGLVQAGRKGKPAGTGDLCPDCNGQRLSELALAVMLEGVNLGQASAWELRDLLAWCQKLSLPPSRRKEGEMLLAQIVRRLENLGRLGLSYLTLNRSAPSLAAGEVLRLRMATALAVDLASVLYILDEPTTGLHPCEFPMLLQVVKELRDRGNTLVLVENNLEVIRNADHVIELGPGAGEEGGRVVYQGSTAELAASAESVTARYLSGQNRIRVRAQRRARRGSFQITGASIHNLNNLSVEVPLGVLCVLTGASGAGKSTLMEEVIYSGLSQVLDRKKKAELRPGAGRVIGAGQLGEVVCMDRRPLPRTARSNPVTYVKAFDAIREEFASTTDAKIRNFDAGAFSFNQPGGRCEECQGQGAVTVDMQFLADLTVACPECQGRRYKKEILDIKVRSLNIAEVLNLTVREAFRFFRAHPAIQKKLKPLLDVGLDYLRLGQATETLSGGEDQRLKLAGHLASSRKPRCLFLLDEPTAGLHPVDVTRLLDCFDRLLQAGHSLLIVENNLAVIKSADHVIDLGPGAGKEGGQVVAAGTPEEIAGVELSRTGLWLRTVI